MEGGGSGEVCNIYVANLYFASISHWNVDSLELSSLYAYWARTVLGKAAMVKTKTVVWSCSTEIDDYGLIPLIGDVLPLFALLLVLSCACCEHGAPRIYLNNTGVGNGKCFLSQLTIQSNTIINKTQRSKRSGCTSKSYVSFVLSWWTKSNDPCAANSSRKTPRNIFCIFFLLLFFSTYRAATSKPAVGWGERERERRRPKRESLPASIKRREIPNASVAISKIARRLIVTVSLSALCSLSSSDFYC